MKASVFLLLAAWCCGASAETVQVKYHGPVSLESFDCSNIKEASDVARICFDPTQRYMLIKLKATYYHYWEVDAGTAKAFRAASSKRSTWKPASRAAGATARLTVEPIRSRSGIGSKCGWPVQRVAG